MDGGLEGLVVFCGQVIIVVRHGIRFRVIGGYVYMYDFCINVQVGFNIASISYGLKVQKVK
jgi:hypothetical protein